MLANVYFGGKEFKLSKDSFILFVFKILVPRPPLYCRTHPELVGKVLGRYANKRREFDHIPGRTVDDASAKDGDMKDKRLCKISATHFLF